MIVMKPSNDEIYTPDWCSIDMIEHFKPSGKILDPCSGGGAFSNKLNCDYCEINEGKDFFDWKEPVDWIISNPPFSKIRKFLLHSFEIADNIVYLVPVWKIFLAYGVVKDTVKYGNIKEIRWYGTGSKLQFPMGNAIGAVYWQRKYTGPLYQTFCDTP